MTCPLCGTTTEDRLTVRTQEAKGHVSVARRCAHCGLIFLEDYAADRSGLYGPDYGAWGSSADEEMIARSKREAFRDQLAGLVRHVAPEGRRLLDVGTGKAYLLDVARDMGFDCWGVELSPYAAAAAERKFPGRIATGTLESAAYPDASFDVVTMTDIIEHLPDPHALFVELRRIVAPGGHVFIITPNTDSLTRAILGSRWFQYKYEHVIYWNPSSLEIALGAAGFRMRSSAGNSKRFRLSYYDEYFRRYSFPGGLGSIFRAVYRLLPTAVREWSFANPVTGEIAVIAQRRE